MKKRQWMVVGVATLAGIAALAWALAPRPVQVEAGTVSLGPFDSAVEEDGKTRLHDAYLISAPLAGQVSRITLREGDPVAAGDIVATMRPALAPLVDARTRRELQARLGAAQAQLGVAGALLERAALERRLAEQERLRSERLARDGFVAANQLDAAQLAARAADKQYDSAQAQQRIAAHELEQARAALDLGSATSAPGPTSLALRAPQGGRVLRVIQPSEAVVPQGAGLLEIGDPGKLDIVAELLTSDAQLVRPGSAVHIDRWGGPVLQGRVERLEPAAFTKISALGVEEQRVRVIINLAAPVPAGASLGIAYRVTVRILTAHQDQVLKVPVSALFPLPASAAAPGPMAVYTIDQGKARLQQVALGGRNEREAWITGGLASGAAVILYPDAQVRDGVRVKVRQVARQP